MALGIYAVVARFGLAAAPVKPKTADRETPAPTGVREETECP
jgi:hypothetical protein